MKHVLSQTCVPQLHDIADCVVGITGYYPIRRYFYFMNSIFPGEQNTVSTQVCSQANQATGLKRVLFSCREEFFVPIDVESEQSNWVA